MTFDTAQITCHRFGLGAKPDELNQVLRIGGKQYLQNQLTNYQPNPAVLAPLLSSQYLMAMAGQTQNSVRQTTDKQSQQKIKKAARQKAHNIYLNAAALRHQNALTTNQSFAERLVYFWQNHFAVSAQKQTTRFLAASFENEAIRPNIMGNFANILLASTRHPAMQIYLDNYKSVGPNSRIGINRKKGLNENLAREILELHTLGVNGGYQQADVVSLANMLTGWGVDYKKTHGFKFNKYAHQNQTTTFLGNQYVADGIKQATAALHALAAHNKTAAFVAKKLAHHFAGNHNLKLTADLAAKLTASFIKTNGQLPPLYDILITHPACWQTNNLRFRTPNEWLIAIMRAGMSPDLGTSIKPQIKPRTLNTALKNMGQQTYFISSPAGWSEDDDHWNSPSAFIQKWQNSKRLVRYMAQNIHQYKTISLGENINQHTQLAVQKAPNKNTRFTLLFLSEQMQFR